MINGHKMAEHFVLSIKDDSFAYSRKSDSIAREGCSEGAIVKVPAIRNQMPS